MANPSFIVKSVLNRTLPDASGSAQLEVNLLVFFSSGREANQTIPVTVRVGADAKTALPIATQKQNLFDVLRLQVLDWEARDAAPDLSPAPDVNGRPRRWDATQPTPTVIDYTKDAPPNDPTQAKL